MLQFEKELFEDLMKCIDHSDKTLNEILNGKKEEEHKNDMIVFLDDVGEFLGIGEEKKGLQVAICLALSDIFIENNSNLKELRTKIQNVIKEKN